MTTEEKLKTPLTAKIFIEQFTSIAKVHPDSIVTIENKPISQASHAISGPDKAELFLIPVPATTEAVATNNPNESEDGGKPPKMHGQAGEGSR